MSLGCPGGRVGALAHLTPLLRFNDATQANAFDGDTVSQRAEYRHMTEPVAKKFEKGHPDLAARLWRAQGMRIINAGKSKYYTAALSNLQRAKRCFERAGLTAPWEATVAQVRADHRRKSGFMLGFEHVVAGGVPREEPSFLERAKARWNKQRGRAR
jgi:hypothetical protein